MTPVLELRDLVFRYPVARGRPGAPFRLSGLSLTVGPGEIVGVIGPNSAGKTTLTRLVTRVCTPDSGEILLEGRALARMPADAVARRIAVVPQEVPAAFPFTVAELVLMGRYPHGPSRYFEAAADRDVARQAMAATGVLDLAGRPLADLGGGERQRALIARALAQEPRLLVLDEPTAHLDLRYQVECAALLRRVNRERDVSILLVSHDLGLAAELSDRLLLLSGGRPVRLGPPGHVLEQALLEEVFGCAVIVEGDAGGHRPRVRVAWKA
jgi:iron complex transport system ATP-binding protein